MHFINRYTWKSLQYYILIIMMASFMRVSQKLVFHQSKCISAIKRKHSVLLPRIYPRALMHLCVPYYCAACLKFSTLCVAVKMLQNTIQFYL